MPIDLVVFDVAGTTVFDGDAVHRCLEEAVRSAGVGTTRDQVNLVMGLPKPLAIGRLVAQARGHSPSSDEVAGIYARFERLMLEHYRRGADIRPTEAAVDVFRSLRAGGVKLALDTGFARTILDAILARLGWDRQWLDATVATNEVERGRPAPDMIWRAMQLCGVSDVSRVGKVGDTPADLEQGRRAGCALVVGVTSGSHSREELEHHPHTHLVSSLSELVPIVLTRNPH